jgi:hypothetical protein
MISALRLGSSLFAAAFVALTTLGAISLSGHAQASPIPIPSPIYGDCGPKDNDGGCPNQCPSGNCKFSNCGCS